MNTTVGPVIAWIDRSSGVANIYVSRYANGAWTPLGSGALGGTGVSGSPTDVADLAVATDGTKVAVAWTETVAGSKHVYLREYSGGSWKELAGSASGSGFSGTTGNSQAPSLAYLNGTLFAAWQDHSSGHWAIYGARYNGTTWTPAGSNATSGAGISLVDGETTQLRLAANDGQLYLLWTQNRFFDFQSGTSSIYARSWNGTVFVEQAPGEANLQGISATGTGAQILAATVDAAGHPFVAWNDTASGSPQIYVRGNQAEIGKVHYVNASVTAGDNFTTAPGSTANDGLTPATPKASVQDVLDSYVLHAGDVIVVDAGTYAEGFTLTAADAGVRIVGASDRPTVIQDLVTLQNADSVELRNLILAGGVQVGVPHEK